MEKTTLLAALLAEVPANERLLVVEDVGEIQIDHPHVVYLQSRTANTEGAGEVSMVDLVRQALRMRPDRLVVGEVRGAEVRDLSIRPQLITGLDTFLRRALRAQVGCCGSRIYRGNRENGEWPPGSIAAGVCPFGAHRPGAVAQRVPVLGDVAGGNPSPFRADVSTIVNEGAEDAWAPT